MREEKLVMIKTLSTLSVRSMRVFLFFPRLLWEGSLWTSIFAAARLSSDGSLQVPWKVRIIHLTRTSELMHA
jgi:hypothetical protein